MKRKLFFQSLIICIICLSFLCGCAGNVVVSDLAKYSVPDKIRMSNSGVLAENNNFVFEWDYKNQCLILTNKKNKTVWSTTPYNYYSNAAKKSDYYAENGLRSMLNISYINAEDNLEKQASSFGDAVDSGFVSGKKIQNGLRLTFYFDEAEISVPLEFVLEKDGLSVNIPIHKITENRNKIDTVSILPFFTSAKNNNNSYLFVPSGTGGLIYTDDILRNSRRYSEDVYGTDAGQQTTFKNAQSETVRMPVFGVKDDSKGMLGIITSGAELASIEATAGDRQYGYSAVYAKFGLRGKATATIKDVNNLNAQVTQYSQALPKIENISVKYIMLEPDNSDYNGMAQTYREYLKHKYNISGSKNKAPVILDFLGGEQTEKFFLGIPHKSTDICTTFEQTKNILNNFIKEANVMPDIRLSGFGTAGLDYGRLAGGFKAAGIFGGNKCFKKLSNFCKDNKVNLYFDFDTVFYSDSGGGYSVRNSATTANTVRAKYYNYNLVTHKQDVYEPVAFLLGRKQLKNIDSRIIKAADNLNIAGVGLSSVSNTIYSDYRYSEYFCKANMAEDVYGIFKSVKAAGLKILSDSANVYAAVLSDGVINTPSNSSKLFCIDEEIPFYQMVFHGITNLFSQPLNLSADPKKELLKAVSVGNAISFTCVNNINDNFINGNFEKISYSVYDDIKDEIIDFTKQIIPVFEAVDDAEIVSYNKDEDLTVTEFSNGVRVYVNFGTNEVTANSVKILSNSFELVK